MEIIVGTAGHIDHGKTALVRALTGTDADRLPEEKQRGITIDIGFAELELDGVHFGFVDVPGHERFVKNMLAGASGIDIVLLIIAADEGVMPQTREHFEICRLLGLERGVIVLTKRDLVDEETLNLARLDAADLVAGSFLENAPVVAVSSVDGSGIDELKRELVAVASLVPARDDTKAAFLPIDRSFTVKGFGAVVTGTLASGEIAEGDELDLLPLGRRVRARGVQTHGRKASGAKAGQRVAVNLAGIDHKEIERGMALAVPDVLRTNQLIDAELEMLGDAAGPLRTRQRVRVHIGTAEVLARVFVINEAGIIEPGGKGFVQLRLESPVASFMGQRIVLRSYSPQATIGGGRVMLTLPAKYRKRDVANAAASLASLESASESHAKIVESLVLAAGRNGITASDIAAETGWRREVLRAAIDEAFAAGQAVTAGQALIAPEVFKELSEKSATAVENFHKREPLAVGIPREALREQVFRFLPADVFAGIIASLQSEGKIIADKETFRSPQHSTELSPAETKAKETILAAYGVARFEPPKTADVLANAASASGLKPAETAKVFDLLLKQKEIVKVTDELAFAAGAIGELKKAIREFADGTQDRVVDVPKFKEIAGVSRKYAIPLLEYFDRERVTVRAGDKRVVLK